jgi:uncharacterized membrane protein YhaH (DUF805 family)
MNKEKVKIAINYINIYFIDVFKKHYRDFDGVATRSQFWWFVLGMFVCSFIFGLIAKILVILFTLATMVPCVAITVRRIRDTGIDYRLGFLSALFYVSIILNLLPKSVLEFGPIRILMALLSLVLFVSFVALLVFCVIPSKQQE